jgi:hypothetical protein
VVLVIVGVIVSARRRAARRLSPERDRGTVHKGHPAERSISITGPPGPADETPDVGVALGGRDRAQLIVMA